MPDSEITQSLLGEVDIEDREDLQQFDIKDVIDRNVEHIVSLTEEPGPTQRVTRSSAYVSSVAIATVSVLILKTPTRPVTKKEAKKTKTKASVASTLANPYYEIHPPTTTKSDDKKEEPKPSTIESSIKANKRNRSPVDQALLNQSDESLPKRQAIGTEGQPVKPFCAIEARDNYQNLPSALAWSV